MTTVGELIEMLGRFDPTLDVAVVDDPEGDLPEGELGVGTWAVEGRTGVLIVVGCYDDDEDGDAVDARFAEIVIEEKQRDEIFRDIDDLL